MSTHPADSRSVLAENLLPTFTLFPCCLVAGDFALPIAVNLFSVLSITSRNPSNVNI